MKTFYFLIGFVTQVTLATPVEVPRYFGSRSLKANVSELGLVEVLNYPRDWSAELTITQWPSPGIYPNLSDTTCETVRLQSQNYRTLPSLAQGRLIENVRGINPVRLKLNLAESFQPRNILSAVRAALSDSGINPTTLQLKNPIILKDVKFRIALTPSAITKLIGETQSLELTLSQQFRDGVLQLGGISGELAAMDLLCDLKAEEATIEAFVTATPSDNSASHLLMDVTKAQMLMTIFNEASTQFLNSDEKRDFGRNRILATSLVYEKFRETRDFDLKEAIQRLTHPRTGAPLRLSPEGLEDALTVPGTSATAYQATVKIEFKEVL